MANINRQKQQYIALGIGVVAIVGLGILVFGVLGPKNPTATPFSAEAQGVDMTIVQDRTSSAAPEMSWITQSRAEIERLRQTVESLNEGITAERQQSTSTIAQLREDYDAVLLQQATKLEELQARADAAPAAPVAVNGQGPIANQNGAFTPDYSATGSEFIERRTGFVPTGQTPSTPNNRPGAAQNIVDENGNTVAPSFGQTFQLTAVEETPNEERNTLRNYIPAGSYASAVVLSGADAATNVADRESPVPVLFRITGPAITAARGGGRGAQINIEGCTVQGSAIGDLSSERVRVRLLTLTCVKRNGIVVEQAISGYMVGAGKAGVRGRVISREGGLVANAAIAGVLGGLANAANSATGGNTTPPNGLGEIVSGAAAAAGVGGVQSAAQTLSDYYINRAEQYQPVISLNGGTNVELVFMEGISLK